LTVYRSCAVTLAICRNAKSNRVNRTEFFMMGWVCDYPLIFH
jgi:hypothetical protein